MDELLNRQAPQSLEAEQAVLGSMLIDSRCVGDVIGMLKPEDFFLRQNQELFETIYSMFNYAEPIDAVTVLNKLKELGHFDEQTTPKYLMQLMEITPTAANVKQYAAIVRDKALLRGISTAADEINETVYSGVGTASEVLEAAEKKIYALRRGTADDALERIGTVLIKTFDRLNELAKSDRDFPGHASGFKDLDRRIHGLNDGNLIILAARPGMGKTTMALNIMANVAKTSHKTVAFFSYEMSKEELARRLLSCESFVDNNKLTTGKLSKEEWSAIGVAASALSQTDIRVSDLGTVTVAEMSALCRRLDNLGLVVIDYLQLMTSAGPGGSSENRVQVVSEITRSLKVMAKELNVPVVCLSQLSRRAEQRDKNDHRPQLSDLRESGSIEQDADIVLMLYRDDYYNADSEEKNIVEVIVSKNRHGEPGTVKLQWLPEFFAFSNLESHRVEQ